jgi:hypothetical protein
MHRTLFRCILAVTTAFIVLAPCSAETIYTNFGPGQTVSPFPTSGWCVSGNTSPFCGPLTDRWIAAPFTPTGNFALTQIDLALVPSSFPFAITSLVSTGGVNLLAGVPYWLVAEGATPASQEFWFGSPLGGTGTELSINDGASWFNPGLFPNPPDPSGGNLPAFDVIGNPILPGLAAAILADDAPSDPPTNGAIVDLVHSQSGLPGTTVLESWFIPTPVTAVPEPSTTFVLLGIGFLSLVGRKVLSRNLG